VGLDGCQAFVELAQKRTGCEVLHQDFLNLDLKPLAFDGVFANASLFHVPTQELERVLLALYTCLRLNGVLFCSNPRGSDIEQFDGDRYGAFLQPETWGNFVRSAGFIELESFYRPSGRPKEQQPWLATVWRKSGCNKDPVEAVAESGLV
jgi:SAM-dependent methyltransferase